MELELFLKQQAKKLKSIPDDFIEQVGAAQREIYDRIVQLLGRLDLDGEYIAMTKKNIGIADEIRDLLPGIMDNSSYKQAVTSYISEFNSLKKIVDKYMVGEFGDSANSSFANAVFDQIKRNAVEQLASSTVKTNFLRPIESQIDIAVQSGQSFYETVKQLREYATGGKVDAGAQYQGQKLPGGKLVQYSKQISYDSIAIADRAYTNAIAVKLKPDWYLYAGGELPTSRNFCIERVGKYFHRKEIESWAILEWQGKPQSLTEENIFIWLGGYNCQHTLIPVTIERIPADVIERNIANGNYTKKISKETKQKIEQVKVDKETEYKNFERDLSLSNEDLKIQDNSIKYFINNKEKLTKEYIKKFGNVANTDDARKLFSVVGYNGVNAPAVHEASSALNKLVTKELIEQGKMNHVVMYAGGAGSGKSSAISGIFTRVKQNADVIIDGNMATYAKSIKQIDFMLENGKTIDIIYVYRDPVDAWTNGVVKRMIENKSEGGRIVPLRIFMENTKGSRETIEKLISLNENKNINISLIDNSLGKGNTNIMSLEKFNTIRYDDDVKKRIIEETKRLLDEGKITSDQYEKLING